MIIPQLIKQKEKKIRVMGFDNIFHSFRKLVPISFLSKYKICIRKYFISIEYTNAVIRNPNITDKFSETLVIK